MRRPGACRNRSIDVVCAPSGKRNKEASGPVSRVLSGTAIYLERESPRASSTQPERTAGHRMALLFALAPDGVCQAATLPPRWCALTAPFQLFSCVAHAARTACSEQGSLLFCGTDPSGRPAQPLAGILPCGARTFLAPLRGYATVWPARLWYCSRTCFTLVEPHE